MYSNRTYRGRAVSGLPCGGGAGQESLGEGEKCVKPWLRYD